MTKRTSLRCPNCGQNFTAMVETLIDAEHNPDAKMRLLSGQINQQACPNCGAPVTLASPILYHDGGKEVLISYVPMELNLTKDQQEKAVGELMRELTAALPREAIKGYIFQPRQALTMQGLVDQVLQADGISPEMMEEQRVRARLIETLARTADEDLPAVIAGMDDQIDQRFIQLMMMMAQQFAEQGQRSAAEAIARAQQALFEHSTFGRMLRERAHRQGEIVKAVSADLDGLPPTADRADLLDLAMNYLDTPDSEDRLQALVGLARPAMDDEFFQTLTMRIGRAPAEDQARLEAMRDQLHALAEVVDRQNQVTMQNALSFLQALVNSPDPEALLRGNLGMIDDALMAVLTANLEEAQRRGDAQMETRLSGVYNQIITFLNANMQPELRFLNELLAIPTDDEARARMQAEGGQFDHGMLLEMIDAVEDILASRGETQMVERLALLREDATALTGD